MLHMTSKHVVNDLRKRDYVALKVYVNTIKANRELSIYQHLHKARSDVIGRAYVRGLLDSFEIEGPHGRHTCLVHEPLGLSLYDLKQRGGGEGFPADMLKSGLRQLLMGLHFLHVGARVIHTGTLASPCSDSTLGHG